MLGTIHQQQNIQQIPATPPHHHTAPSRSIKTTRELLPIKLAIKVPFQNICNAVAAVLQIAVEADHDMLDIKISIDRRRDQ